MTPKPLARRRNVLGALLAAGTLPTWSGLSLAASTHAAGRRLVLVILRGGMDGLSAAPSLGDPDFAAARSGTSQPPRCRWTRPLRCTRS